METLLATGGTGASGRSADGIDPSVLSRRLLFRAWHRGSSEADLLLGPFADECVDQLNLAQLKMLDLLLEEDDPTIYDWVNGRQPVPAHQENVVMEYLRRFALASQRIGGSHARRS